MLSTELAYIPLGRKPLSAAVLSVTVPISVPRRCYALGHSLCGYVYYKMIR